jgi:hypothetical protein
MTLGRGGDLICYFLLEQAKTLSKRVKGMDVLGEGLILQT